MHTGGRVKEGWGIEYVIFIYVVNTSYNYAFGDYWTASGCSGPSIVGGSKLGPTERELASHQHSRTLPAILYNVAV